MAGPADSIEIATIGSGADRIIAALRGRGVGSIVDRVGASTRVMILGSMPANELSATLADYAGVAIVVDATVEQQLSSVAASTPGRLIGLGSAVETITLRRAIGARLKLAASQVHAWVVGAIGKPTLALWSSASAAGVPLHEWAVAGHGKLTVRDRIDLLMSARQSIASPESADRVEAAVRVIESIALDHNDVLPVMRHIDRSPIPEFVGRWMSLPCILNATGAEPPLPLKLNDAESAALKNV
jgi:malate/lactate dehydrogenase